MTSALEHSDTVSTQVDVTPIEVIPGQFDHVHDTERRLFARPAYKRTDTGLTVAVLESDIENAKTDDHDLKLQDDMLVSLTNPTNPTPVSDLLQEMTYPPAAAAIAQEIAVVELNDETISRRRLRMFASFIAFFLAGWNGGSTGALIPYIERAHGISYATVSLLFVCTFVGYVIAALGAGTLSRRVGFGHALCISVVVELLGNVINSSQQVSFPLMCFGFFVVGLAFATQLGLCNAYFAALDKPLQWTGLLHGIYGLGAFASPLVATAMVSKGVPYHFFYTTNVGMNVPVFALIWAAFRDLHEIPTHTNDTTANQPVEQSNKAFWDTLKSRPVWTLAIFLMLYVGAEESLGGWIVSYILEVRNGTPEGASWVASGFYLGVAVGRIALPALNLWIGERRAVFLYILIAIALECVAWFLPIMAATAVCTALVGVAISTFYASAITTGAKLVPRHMHADAFALMSSVGQSGSAFWPLIVGIMSTKRGIWVVEPTVVALLGAQGICWWLVPKPGRRIE